MFSEVYHREARFYVARNQFYVAFIQIWLSVHKVAKTHLCITGTCFIHGPPLLVLLVRVAHV